MKILSINSLKFSHRGKVHLWTALTLLGFHAGAKAHAASLITDGGFEASSAGNLYYAGQSIDAGAWTVTKGAAYIDTQDPYVFAGNNSLNLTYANLYVPNIVSQVIATVVGQGYQVSFWGDADTANTFSLTENGVTLSGLPSSIANMGFPGVTNSSLFTNYMSTFLATSTSTTFNLTATASPAIGSADGSVMIDNFSVAATPEPGSLLLTITGLAGLGQAVRLRRLGGAR